MGETRAIELAAGDPLDPSPSAAAPTAGGRVIDGSRRVHSLGVRGFLAGGALEVEARPEKVLETAVLSSSRGAPVEDPGRSGVSGASAALRSRGVPPLEPASMVVVAALDLGVRLPSPACEAVLLAKSAGSLQVLCSPSSASLVGFAEDGWCRRLRLRREAEMVAWRRLSADSRSASRCRRLRRLASAALQQGWLSFLLRGVVCVVAPWSSCLGCFVRAFVCVCSSVV